MRRPGRPQLQRLLHLRQRPEQPDGRRRGREGDRVDVQDLLGGEGDVEEVGGVVLQGEGSITQPLFSFFCYEMRTKGPLPLSLSVA